MCGGYTTVVNWDAALPLVLVEDETDSVLGTNNLGTHTLADSVSSPAYLCVLHGIELMLTLVVLFEQLAPHKC